MEEKQARNLVKDVLENAFDKLKFIRFVRELLNFYEEALFVYSGDDIPNAYDEYISSFERIGKYTDGENKIDILIVNLKKGSSLERARTAQRNFIAWYLNGKGKEQKDAGLVAFVSPEFDDWRFSLVKMEYKFIGSKTGKIKVKEEFTPAKRWSFLVGKNENSHTAQSKLAPIVEDDNNSPTLKRLEDAFNIEKVTEEFFEKYRDLFHRTKDALDELVSKNEKLRNDFKEKFVDTTDFSKKLLGQIVFLYFLQKKGWFGVPINKIWGDGDKSFLRTLFEEADGKSKNYFNDYLEPLFYEALSKERDDDFYSRFECKIPFLNGGLFDPISNYDWVNTAIDLPNDIFSNTRKTKDGDTGDGVLDIFDRYNFTVKEDEPLEKEVAVDPEMLGKVFEKLLEAKDRKSKGTYYTPRDIVRYMCQESLINYLVNSTNIGEESIKKLITKNDILSDEELANRIDKFNQIELEEIATKQIFLNKKQARELDAVLSTIKVVDPACGSGAFLVGILNEIIEARKYLHNWFLSAEKNFIYRLKRECIENNLYGVDIDPGAVEIAKLRLWLSLVVDEDDIKQIKPLPNLDYKIMQGNSLLEEYEGIKLFDEKLIAAVNDSKKEIESLKQKQAILQKEYIKLHNTNKLTSNKQAELDEVSKRLSLQIKKLVMFKHINDTAGLFDKHSEAKRKADELKRLHKDFFEATQKRKKDNIKKQIEQLEWELIEATLKEQNKISALKKLDEFKRSNTKPFFLWKLNFADVFEEKGGFDVVIANPPYVFTREGDFDTDIKKQIYNKFLKYLSGSQTGRAKQSGKINLYAIFVLQSLNLLKTGGHLSYILPNTLLRATVYDVIRKYILDNTKIINITDLSSGVFENVTASTVLLFLQNSHAGSNSKISIYDSLPTEKGSKISIVTQEGFYRNISYTFNIFSNELSDSIVSKAIIRGRRLDVFVNILAGGIATGPGKKNYIFDTPFSPLHKPLIEGKDVKKYHINFNNKYILYDRKKLYRAREESLFLKDEKLITQRIGGGKYPLVVAYDDKQYYTFNSTNSIFLKDGAHVSLKYILALLNSKFLNWFYTTQFTNKSSLTVNISKTFLEQLPIIDSDNENKIVSLVDDILKITKTDDYLENPEKQAKVRDFEHHIDELVYKLYGLTSEEIKIIEDSSK